MGTDRPSPSFQDGRLKIRYRNVSKNKHHTKKPSERNVNILRKSFTTDCEAYQNLL